MAWKVPKIWQDGECWIIGGGPSFLPMFGVPEQVVNSVCQRKIPDSVYSDYLSALHDRHVIGVNNVYRLGNWIDFVFFGDSSWHLVHASALNKWTGMKVTCSPKFANYTDNQSHGIKYLARDPNRTQGISQDPRKISWNNNSGAASINLAYHLGVRRILLLGYDMRMSENNYSHWHGSHQPVGKKVTPPFNRHMRGFPIIARDAKKLGIEILNVNPNSAIDVFPKVELKDVL